MALCTCPIDAAAIGLSSNSAKSSALPPVRTQLGTKSGLQLRPRHNVRSGPRPRQGGSQRRGQQGVVLDREHLSQLEGGAAHAAERGGEALGRGLGDEEAGGKLSPKKKSLEEEGGGGELDPSPPIAAESLSTATPAAIETPRRAKPRARASAEEGTRRSLEAKEEKKKKKKRKKSKSFFGLESSSGASTGRSRTRSLSPPGRSAAPREGQGASGWGGGSGEEERGAGADEALRLRPERRGRGKRKKRRCWRSRLSPTTMLLRCRFLYGPLELSAADQASERRSAPRGAPSAPPRKGGRRSPEEGMELTNENPRFVLPALSPSSSSSLSPRSRAFPRACCPRRRAGDEGEALQDAPPVRRVGRQGISKGRKKEYSKEKKKSEKKSK